MTEFEGNDFVDHPSDLDSWQPASPKARITSFLIDGFIVFGLLELVLLFSQITPPWNAQVYLWAILMWAWEGMLLTFWGKTPGRYLLKLAIYSPNDGSPPSPLQVCVRILIFWTTSPLLGLGLTPILFRADRCGWHDLLSETVTTTRGNPAHRPSPRWKRIGHSLILVQALIVFAVGGAALLSNGIRLTHDSDGQASQLSCENAQISYEDPSSFLAALLIAPSWNSCWQKMRNILSPFKTSNYFDLIEITNKAHQLSLYNPDIQGLIFRKQLSPMIHRLCQRGPNDDSCSAAKFFDFVWGSASAAPSNSNEQNWFSPHAVFLKQLLTAKDFQQRILLCTDYLKTKSDSPLLQAALTERLWLETLPWEEHRVMETPPIANMDWLQQQVCWQEALDKSTDNRCSPNPYRYGVEFIKRVNENTVSIEEVENFLGDNRQLPEDIEQALQLWVALKKQNTQEAVKLWRETQQLNPLYGFTSQWYKSLK